MTPLDWAFLILCVCFLGSVCAAAALAPRFAVFRFGVAQTGPGAAGLAMEKALGPQALQIAQQMFLHQYRYSFWVVMGASGAATLVLALALLQGIVFSTETTVATAVVGLVGGLGGGTGLFAYARSRWRVAFQDVHDYFTPAPGSPALGELLRQHLAAFWFMMAALIVALAMLTLALLVALYWKGIEPLEKIISVTIGLGNSAFFLFNALVHRDCRRSLRDFV
jgi:hypothetical protein